MKITKKVISVLIMIMGMLILSMTAVNAASLPVQGNKVKGNKLDANTTYDIDLGDYRQRENLHCAQPKYKMSQWSTRKYKLIAHVHIKGEQAYLCNLSTKKKIAKSAVEGRFNLKMATGIATLSEANQGYFIWGYLKPWINKVNEKNPQYYGKLQGFAVRNISEEKNPNYDDINKTVEKRMDQFGTTEVKEFKMKKDKDNFGYVDIDNGNYVRVGPYTLTGIPSVGLASFKIFDQNGTDITKSVSFITYTEDKKRKEIEYDQIKEGKKFYLCIPKNKNVTSITAEVKTKKVKEKIPECDIYFLECTNDVSWQNLVVTEGDTNDSGKGDNLEVTFDEDMPGDLTIIKEDSNNKEKLSGAKFAIFKYVKDDNGTWYKKGDTYTENEREATDKTTKYKRAYVHKIKSSYTYEKVDLERTVKGDSSYHFTTGSDGKINLTSLKAGTYFAVELEAPEGYKKIDGFFQLGAVKASEKKEVYVNNELDNTKVEITKVNGNNNEIVLEGIGFKFYQEESGWLREINKGQYVYTKNENEATWFKTDANGKIYLDNVRVGNWKYYEDPKTLPYGYDITGEEEGSFTLESKDVNKITIRNTQKYVKLSGFVWVDKVGVKSGDGNDRNDLFKTNQDGQHPDEKDLLFDGITVKLKDKTTGNTVQETVTSNLGRYTDYGHNGHGEYLFENVEIKKLGNYYIEFTYDGLNYTNVVPHIDQSTGSKAAESDRTTFNNKFSVIEGKTKNTGVAKGTDGRETALTYSIDEKEKTATLNNDGKYTETDSYIVQNSIGDFIITANTNATKYSIEENFVDGQEEIRNINLGLKDRDRPDITLGKDIQNVKISVNGYDHTYHYAQRYANGATEYDGEGFNVGVKFKNNYTGTYTRAIYKSDYEYNPNNADKELKVYITYQLKMAQSNINLKAQVNSITDYFDSKYTLEKVYSLDAQGKEVSITASNPERYNDKYSKIVINNNTKLEGQKEQDIYVQFRLSREQVLAILRDKGVGEKADELLNNVAEINSYSIFDMDGNTYAGVDKDSNPGNCDPENENTYEDDTSASPGLQLEVANGRVMTGKVFIDNHVVKNRENPNEVMTGIIRQGNGKYDDGEASVKGVPVTLTENTGSGKVYTATTDGNGDFKIENYIPGDYTLTYTWGGQTYKLNGQDTEITVQDYKGTVYDSKRDQKNKRWWYVATKQDGTKEVAERLTDAIDNYNTDQEAPKGSRVQIDEELKNLNKDTRNNITRKQMDSTTPTMGIGVEYETTYSASAGDRYTYSIDNIDFGIIERPKQDLVLTKRVKSMKVTLANGQVIANLTVDEDGKVQGEKNGITYMKPSAMTTPINGFIRLELDNELIQGTKLEVEYEITVKNNSELDYISEDFYKYGINPVNPITMTPTGIVDYLDKNWSFDNKNGENTKWEVKTVDGIKDLVMKEVYDSSNKDTTIGQKMILYTNQLAQEKLAVGDSKSIKLNVSKILTTTDEIALDNETEEVTATKTGGAMIQSTLGNYVPGAGITESDDSMAETTIVTPATGDNRAYIVPIIIGATALIILGTGVIVIKKKVI